MMRVQNSGLGHRSVPPNALSQLERKIERLPGDPGGLEFLSLCDVVLRRVLQGGSHDRDLARTPPARS